MKVARGAFGHEMTGCWYLVYCKQRQEVTARRNLERQGYKVYLPLVRQRRRRDSSVLYTAAPMFPRYLFICLSEDTDNWGPIRSTIGVVSLVRFGQAPAAVPHELITLFKQREDAEGFQPLPTRQFRAGTKIRITEGSFAGYEAVFLASSGRDRVTVLLKVLGRHTRASVDPQTIEPAS